MRWMVLLYPLAELWSLIELGAQTSASVALLWVLVAGLGGVLAIRVAGTQVLSRLQAAQRQAGLQQNLLAGDMALAVAGLLLIVPGLLSDALAILVLIRPLRRVGVRFLGFRAAASEGYFTHTQSQHTRRDSSSAAPFEPEEGLTLEGEFHELDAKHQTLERPEADPLDRP